MQSEFAQLPLKVMGISMCISCIDNLPLIVLFNLTKGNFKLQTEMCYLLKCTRTTVHSFHFVPLLSTNAEHSPQMI